MKKMKFFGVLLPILALIFTAYACSDDTEDPTVNLTQDEIQTLQFMHEEEKLARDVYQYLGDLYGLNIFDNIAASEQKHMDMVFDVMEIYQVEDLNLDGKGIYSNETLNGLYQDLTELGSESLESALWVGATIEDLDIFDLNNATAKTDVQILDELYETLTCGSRNHMRAFTGQLEDLGVVYEPQYISTELYQTILNGSHEQCNNN